MTSWADSPTDPVQAAMVQRPARAGTFGPVSSAQSPDDRTGAGGSKDVNAPAAVVIDRAGLDALIHVLMADGYRVVGPTVRDGAIVLAELDSPDQLPAGWGVDVAPGHYRLHPRGDGAVFAHSAGPQSCKQFLHPARQRLWSSRPDGAYSADSGGAPRYAFVGVRGCDLADVGIFNIVLAGGAHSDFSYARRRRQGTFVLAVNCTEPGGACPDFRRCWAHGRPNLLADQPECRESWIGSCYYRRG